jgi:O-antigen/teichoic acid export membrane protein
MARSVVRNFVSALTGNGIYAAMQFVMLVAMAQLTSTKQLGEYTYALALTAPVFIFLGLKLRQVQVTDAAGENKPGEFYSLRTFCMVLGFVISVALGWVIGLRGEALAILVWVAAHKALEQMIDILYGTLQRKELLHLVARAQIARGIGGTIVFTGVLWWTERVEVAAAALAAFTALALVGNAIQVWFQGVPLWLSLDVGVLWRLTLLALPLGFSVAIGSLISSVPMYTIERLDGLSQVGIFSALAYLLSAAGMVSNSLGEAVSPRLSNQYVAGDAAAFRRTLRGSVLFGVALGAAGVLFALVAGRLFLDLVYGDVYARHADVLVVLMAAGGINLGFVFIGTAVNALRMFKVQLPITVLTLVTITIACVWLVPLWGLMGAAAAVGVANVTTGLCYLGLYLRRVRPRLDALGQRTVSPEPTPGGGTAQRR